MATLSRISNHLNISQAAATRVFDGMYGGRALEATRRRVVAPAALFNAELGSVVEFAKSGATTVTVVRSLHTVFHHWVTAERYPGCVNFSWTRWSPDPPTQ